MKCEFCDGEMVEKEKGTFECNECEMVVKYEVEK